MAYEQYNVPLAGDILDDLAMAFREIISKVCFKYLQSKLDRILKIFKIDE